MKKLEYQFIEALSKLPFVEEIWLYGSRARKDNLSRSDIDLAIMAPTASEDDWTSVIEVIENADTLLKIDCVWFNKLKENDPLKANILRDKKVLYQRLR